MRLSLCCVALFVWAGCADAPTIAETTQAARILATIAEIQGSGTTSPFADGTEVTTSGIVTARRANGFFMQMPGGDSDDNTSDGIFVFTGSPVPTAGVGDHVSVNAEVLE